MWKKKEPVDNWWSIQFNIWEKLSQYLIFGSIVTCFSETKKNILHRGNIEILRSVQISVWFFEERKILKKVSHSRDYGRNYRRWTAHLHGTIRFSRTLGLAAEPPGPTVSRWCWAYRQAEVIMEAAIWCRPVAVSYTNWTPPTARHRIIRQRRSISITCSNNSNSRKSSKSSSCPACMRRCRHRPRTSPLQHLPASRRPRRVSSRVCNSVTRSRGSQTIQSTHSRQVTMLDYLLYFLFVIFFFVMRLSSFLQKLSKLFVTVS